jgi:hypothetical protein
MEIATAHQADYNPDVPSSGLATVNFLKAL